MWLFTTFGFFSVVQKPNTDYLTVRARVADDLDNLREKYLPGLSATTTKGGGDYPYRATVSHAAFAAAMGKIVEGLHYSNFKSQVATEQGWDREGVYAGVWSILRQLETRPGRPFKKAITEKKSKPSHQPSSSHGDGAPAGNANKTFLLPSPNSYWVTAGKLLAGEYPGAKSETEAREKLRQFLDAGVSFFLDLTKEGEAKLNPYVPLLQQEAAKRGVAAEHVRLPIVDVSVPRAKREMIRILDTIDEALAAGQCVYVHCRGGAGRTGMVVGCHLVRHGMTGNRALRQVAELWRTVEKHPHWPKSPQTDDQRDWVRKWSEPKRASSSPQAKPAVITTNPDLLGRYQGCLLGLAVGDAVGTTLEFKSPGSFKPINDMIGGGPFGLKPGQWTDDTSMALCLAESLVECKGFDAKDQMDRYVRWWTEGYLSSTGRCFDIGITVREALSRFRQNGNPLAGSTDPNKAGNGSLMRLAPVPLFFANDPATAIEMAGESSKTTHATATAVDACRYMAGLIVGALNGASKDQLLSECYSPVAGHWEKHPLCPEIAEIAAGSFKRKNPPQIRGTGYVVHSLEAALWAFHRTDNFRDAILNAVNLGEDADTTGAVCGQLAGAFYGEQGIPRQWLERLCQRPLIEQLVERLLAGAANEST